MANSLREGIGKKKTNSQIQLNALKIIRQGLIQPTRRREERVGSGAGTGFVRRGDSIFEGREGKGNSLKDTGTTVWIVYEP